MPSIDRNYRRYLYFQIWKRLLNKNKIIEENFPKYYKISGFSEYQAKDRNPQKLVKIYKNNIFEKWLEVDGNYEQRNNNSIVYFLIDNKMEFGRIKEIIRSEEEEVYVRIQKLNSYKLDVFNIYLVVDQQTLFTVKEDYILGYFSVIKYYNETWIIPIIK